VCDPFGFLAPGEIQIIRHSHLSTLRIPDYGYSRNASCALC